MSRVAVIRRTLSPLQGSVLFCVCSVQPLPTAQLVCLFGGFPFLLNSHGVIPMTVLCVITNNHRGLALQLERVIVDRCSHMKKRFRKLENPFPFKNGF